ncbi:MAG TPA: hypothetical protein DCF33_10770, partial [Saprospirales bacterium]|nr:hypothetical protein [Saprospirales bacterium]
MKGQESFTILLEDADIQATKIVRGDGDTYGLGDWHCRYSVSLQENAILLEGRIVFSEKANDHSIIAGTFKKRIQVEALERCRHCVIQLDPSEGTVSGPNIGARGYRWFAGQGLIRKAKIQTDVFGEDAGYIGGTIQFVPVRVLVDCLITTVMNDGTMD